jgi:hypothetical protein
MTTKWILTRDINGYNGFGLPFTDTAYSATLTANTDTSLVVPSTNPPGGNSYEGNAKAVLIAIFSFDPGTSVWVARNAVASAPAGASFAATSSELNPAARQVYAGDTLHFYSTGTAVNISVLFYWIGQ